MTDQPTTIVPADGISLKDAVSRYERNMILQSLELANGVQKKKAEELRKQIEGGQDFATVARASSEAPEAEATGGEVAGRRGGWWERPSLAWTPRRPGSIWARTWGFP